MARARYVDYWQLREDLLGGSRFRELAPAEIIQVGRLVYGRAEDMALYGVSAPRMFASGLRVLGSTAIECAVDMHCAAIAEVLHVHLGRPPVAPDMLVADLFCGSGNVGFHLGRRLGVMVQASELDSRIYAATRHNLAAIRAPVVLHRMDYREMLGRLTPRGPYDTYIVEPSWGAALSPEGLDLDATTPPLGTILEDIRESREGKGFLVVIKTNDRIARNSLRRAFGSARHLHACMPTPTLPTGSNVHFHLFAFQGSRAVS
ncbi:hypothetical protein [Chondromyces apiculatus]|uniref:Uncharacterized protein n=1 Tax=Chondromyces apiculatus DSM 436 TaxID=1192034 RepID=A0A017SV40_9BACT|nr:hypothetical protein [Chondromyces apiculatus]EYF00844.1 Hypothetical protein CAP_8933 [Chondromyces apiculatus DSM 436]